MIKSVTDVEAAIGNESPQPEQHATGSHIEWVVAFCLGFAAQPVQTTTSSSKTYDEAGLVLIMCSFSILFMSRCKCFGYSGTRGAMERVGLFFGVTAFFIRSTCQSSAWLVCVGWTVYALTWLAIFVFTAINNRPVSMSQPSTDM